MEMLTLDRRLNYINRFFPFGTIPTVFSLRITAYTERPPVCVTSRNKCDDKHGDVTP
jgi:hypothetical protein